MININCKHKVKVDIYEVDILSKEEKFNLGYKELNVYIEHYPKRCIIKIEKDTKYNYDKINKYLNKGIYPFYEMMFSEELLPNKKIQLINEIYHYIQISDFVFFDAIKDLLEIYKFNNEKTLDKIHVTQEMFAINNIDHDNNFNIDITYEEIMSNGGILKKEDFKNTVNYIQSF